MSTRQGKPLLFSRRCTTCVFRAGNPMRLPPGRFAQLVRDNQATGSMLICHDTTYGQRPDLGEVMCRGYFDAYAATSRVALIMAEMFGPDWYAEVAPHPPTRAEETPVSDDTPTTSPPAAITLLHARVSVDLDGRTPTEVVQEFLAHVHAFPGYRIAVAGNCAPGEQPDIQSSWPQELT